MEYYPFGKIRTEQGDKESPYKFTGKELSETTGLYYYGARFYDPQLGRFITPDTIVPNYANPQSLNRYSYVYNSPLNYTDPTGHCPFCIAVLVGAAIGAGSNAAIASTTGQNVGQAAMAGAASGAIIGGGGVIASAFGAFGSAVTLTLAGAGSGAGIGAGFGLASAYHPKSFIGRVGKVGAYGTLGGIASKLRGGSFERGFMFSGATAAMGEFYQAEIDAANLKDNYKLS